MFWTVCKKAQVHIKWVTTIWIWTILNFNNLHTVLFCFAPCNFCSLLAATILEWPFFKACKAHEPRGGNISSSARNDVLSRVKRFVTRVSYESKLNTTEHIYQTHLYAQNPGLIGV